MAISEDMRAYESGDAGSAYRERPSFSGLFTELIDRVTTLMRGEIHLAQAEISEKINKVVGSLGVIASGAVLLMAGLVVLLGAAVAGLVALGLSTGWAALAVGGFVTIIGGIMLMVGMSALKARNLAPRRTIEQLQADAATAKQQVR